MQGKSDTRRSLGEFEVLLLLAVLRLRSQAYGAGVLREIEETTGREVSQGAVYTGLDRLEARGLVSSTVGEPTPERGGRRRRYYRLETRGALSLSRSLQAIERMARGAREQLRLAAQEGGGL